MKTPRIPIEEQQIAKLLFFAMVVLMLVLLFATYKNISGFQDSVTVIRDRTAKKIALDGVMSAVRDQETGVRGYLITSDVSFLDPYRASKVDHLRYLHDAYELFDDPQDIKELDSLERATVRLNEIWAERIRMVGATQQDSSLANVPSLIFDKRRWIRRDGSMHVSRIDWYQSVKQLWKPKHPKVSLRLLC